MTLEKRIQNRSLQVLQHICFWVLSLFLFLLAITHGRTVTGYYVLYTLLFHILLLPAVYLNLNNFLYRLRVRYGWYKYTAKLSLVIFISTIVNFYFFEYWAAHIFTAYSFTSYFKWWEIPIVYFGYITITTLIKGTRSWFLLWKVRSELQVAEKQKVQLELQALKSQINPHFLFNTLNGIYSMSLDNDKRLPQTVLQLSELMRYFLYEAKDDFVPLAKELALLQNYISLQKLRLGETLPVDVTIKGNPGNHTIAPMLLITFLENAFKHGNKGKTDSPLLILRIEVANDSLDFYLENEKGAVDDMEDKQYGGVGLANIKRRLELLYPGKHRLTINDKANKYIVHLQLTLYVDQMYHHRG